MHLRASNIGRKSGNTVPEEFVHLESNYIDDLMQAYLPQAVSYSAITLDGWANGFLPVRAALFDTGATANFVSTAWVTLNATQLSIAQCSTCVLLGDSKTKRNISGRAYLEIEFIDHQGYRHSASYRLYGIRYNPGSQGHDGQNSMEFEIAKAVVNPGVRIRAGVGNMDVLQRKQEPSDENRGALGMSSSRDKRGLQNNDIFRNAMASEASSALAVPVKPVASKARPQQIRFQEQTDAISPLHGNGAFSPSPVVGTPQTAARGNCETTGGGNRKLMAGRTPHQLVGSQESVTAAASPLPLGSLFNYDYSYQSVAKPGRDQPRMSSAQENYHESQQMLQLNADVVQGSMHGLRLSPSPLPQRSRPPSDQFTMDSPNPSPMKQQTEEAHSLYAFAAPNYPNKPPTSRSYGQNEAAPNALNRTKQNVALHPASMTTFNNTIAADNAIWGSFSFEQGVQALQNPAPIHVGFPAAQHADHADHNLLVPQQFLQGSYTDIFGNAADGSPDQAAEKVVASLISPSKRAPFSALKDRVLQETRGSDAPGSSARAASAPPMSMRPNSNSLHSIILADSRPVGAVDDNALNPTSSRWGMLGHPQYHAAVATTGQSVQPLALEKTSLFGGHHLSIPSMHGLDTRAPVGMYRTDLERASLYSGKLNHFDEYQRHLASTGAPSKSANVKLGLNLGVSLSRPGLGSRMAAATASGPPEAARNLVAGSTCPRPEWNEKERAALLLQANMRQALSDTDAPAVPAFVRTVAPVPSAAVAAPTEQTLSMLSLVSSPRDVAAVAALKHVYSTRHVDSNLNFDVSSDSSIEGDISKKTATLGEVVAKAASSRRGMTAQLHDETQDELDFGLGEVVASLQKHDVSAKKSQNSDSYKAHLTKNVKKAVFANKVSSMPTPFLRLGAAQRVKASQNEYYNDESGIGLTTMAAASPVQRRRDDYQSGKPRDLSDEDSDITFDTEQVFCKDRQSVVSFSVDVGLQDGSERDESGAAFLDASYNNVATSPIPTDADTSSYSTVADTTITVDNSFLNESYGNDIDKIAAPRLVVGPRRRKSGAIGAMAEDMKEITLQCVPGEFTTIVLTFSNKRNSKLVLRPRAILVRFDKTSGAGEADRAGDVSTVTAGPTGNIFQVSPSLINLQSGESGNLYITFSPTQDAEGIYGGALKIKSRGKVTIDYKFRFLMAPSTMSTI